MKTYKAGEKSQALCEQCGLVHTTFKMRDVIVVTNRPTLLNILAGVCDKCDAVVTTLPQSTPEIKAALETKFQ